MENYDQLVEKLTPKILAAIRAKSKPVESLNVKDNMDGIVSMPCYDTNGGIFKAVLVPLDVLRKPALDAEESANNAINIVNGLIDKTNQNIDLSNSLLEQVTVNEQNRQENEQNRQANEDERNSNETERIVLFNTMQDNNANAVDYALEVASHPTYIGEDNYVYEWDYIAKSYNKTSVYVRGESFSISKVYKSVAEMESDTSHGLKEGDFVLINTNDVENPDNAKIFVVDAQGMFTFLVDMSGAIGFTGKTPQISVGSVILGQNKDALSIVLENDGVDASGNPKFKFNFVIPCLAYEDLTDAQIKELQRPASDMIQTLEQTNDTAIQLSDEIKSNPPRIDSNGFWEVWDASARIYVNTNVVARGKQPIIQSGIWYLWNDDTQQYENTGYYASGSDCPTVDSIPSSETTTYNVNGNTYVFYIGQLCRHYNGSDWDIYILKDLSDNGAVWQKWYEDLYKQRIESLEKSILLKQDTINDLEDIRESALFNEGVNTNVDLSSIPINKRLCTASISSSVVLNMSATPKAGREVHIIVNNTSSEAQNIALPNTGSYVCMIDSVLSVDSGAYVELNIISDGSKMYIRGI